MDVRSIPETNKSQYNNLVSHVMQSWQWGEFRKSMGIKVRRYGLFENDKLNSAFQITFHQIPFTNQYIGYLPKGPFSDKELAGALKKIGREQNCAFIKAEPNVIASEDKHLRGEVPADPLARHLGGEAEYTDSGQARMTNGIAKDFRFSSKPLFTKYNFLIDLTKSEEELLKNMHPKTRYNLKLAQKHGVKVEERTDDEAFKIYLKLYFETTKRQSYHGHNEDYHKKVWETLKKSGMARILIAFFRPPNSDIRLPLTAWMLFNFKDTLYYPYGGSSIAHKEVMANNLIAWEAIKLGKKMGLETFDMWGALGPNPDLNDPWIGFHNFKKGYGGKLVEYIGTFDLVLNWPLYFAFTFVDKLMPLKVFLLRLIER